MRTASQAMREMSQGTTVHRGDGLIRNALVNLKSMLDKPKPCAIGAWDLGGSVALVGAGSSLNRNGHLLGKWQGAGGLVMTCNTAVGALQRLSVVPNVVVAMEQVDVSDQLRGCGATVVCALSAHPNVFAMADAWFGEASCWQNHLCGMLGVKPLHTGSAAMTAAFWLAREWQAWGITLLGMDLCFNLGGGKQYAEGARWNLTCADGGDHIAIGGQEERHALHDAAGIPRMPDKRAAWELPGIDGKPVLTSLELLEQVDWFEKRASSQTLNCSEWGVKLDGWRHEPFAERVPSQCLLVPRWRKAGDPVRAVDALKAQAEASIKHARAAIARVPMMPMASPLIEQMAAPTILRVHEESALNPYPPLERIDAIYSAIVDAGSAVLELLC